MFCAQHPSSAHELPTAPIRQGGFLQRLAQFLVPTGNDVT